MNLSRLRGTYQRANSNDPSNVQESISLTYLHDISPQSRHSLAAVGNQQHNSETVQRNKDYTKSSFEPSRKNTRFSGWRSGAYSAAAIATCTLIINVAAAIWLGSHPDADSKLVTIFVGDCHTTKWANVWIHLIINIISTLLLGGSNYCMQCLCAPTRSEINVAHAKGRMLDIGVPSIRNLSHIAPSRLVMWWLLALSSIPLHLMYNSAFYSSLATNDYFTFVVQPDFLQGANATFNMEPVQASSRVIFYIDPDTPAIIQSQLISNTTHVYDRLDVRTCLQEYGQMFLSTRRNLILVSANTSADMPAVLWGNMYSFANSVAPSTAATPNPYDWICDSDPEVLSQFGGYDPTRGCPAYLPELMNVVDEWRPDGWTVDYCLAERTQPRCSLNGNLPIVIIVIFANAIKVLLMLIVASRLRGAPLITVGDAIESFLDEPEQTTKGVCLLDRYQAARCTKINVRKYRNPSHRWALAMDDPTGGVQIARRKVLRWSNAASRMRWLVTIGTLLGALLVVLICMIVAIHTIYSGSHGGVTTPWHLGFAEVHPSAVIGGWGIEDLQDPSSQITASILIANLPQAILSLLYFNLNGLLTAMWTASELSTFATKRKFLRVSTPQGQQRSNHFLQLPYKAAVPLMTLSGILHWLVSQSIFLVVVAEYSSQGALSSAVAMASCGFSPKAMVAVLCIGILPVLATIAVSRQKLDSSMPLISSCSAALSAACHRPDWDKLASTSAVQWGAIPESIVGNGIGHCCFTSGDVEPVQEGHRYGRLIDSNKGW